MNQPELTLDAPAQTTNAAAQSTTGALLARSREMPSVASGTVGGASAGASTPCQNPGCPHHIVPADASDERCPDCGHAIRDEEVMCNDADDSTCTRQPVATADTATGASHKRPAKAPASPPDPAGPRSIAARIVSLAQQLALTDAEVGELDVLMDREMNTGSPKLLDWLYGDTDKGGCGFPARYKKSGGKNTDSLARSTDALLATFRMNRDERLRLCLTLIGLKKQISVLGLKTDSDGRVRFSINVAGTKVGRWSVSESSTGSGTNMQTISEPHRHLFPADAGGDFYSIDLRGADGWTIAAECVALGDSRMWDDLHTGLKPANAVLLLWNHGQQVNQWPMAQCLDEQAKLDKAHWKYAACKAGIWGTCLTRLHEVLTPMGWQPIAALAKGVPIATWKKGLIRWSVPTRLIHQRYTGTLYRFTGNSFHLEATANHRMPYSCGKNWQVTTADKIANMSSARLPLSGTWQEGRPQPLARLIAAIQSDGHYTKDQRLHFTFRKQRKIDRIRTLLKQHNIVFVESRYWVKRDKTWDTVIRCRNAPVVPKRCGLWMLDWDAASLSAFCEEYVHWDGHIGKSRDIRTLYSSDKEHLMWIALFRRLTATGFTYQGGWGEVTNTRRANHRMAINNRTSARMSSMKVNKRKVVNQPVYCVETEDGYFLVRHGDKIMVTGNCYGEGDVTLSTNILVEAWKSSGELMYVSAADCKKLQAAVFARYPGIKRRMERINMLLARDGGLTNCAGFARDFFGRKSDAATQRLAYAYTPAFNTAYCNNQALLRLWRDPDNIAPDGQRIFKPRLGVHDSILGCAPVERRDWAKGKIAEWWSSPITVAGLTFTIPAESKRGPNWGDLHTI